MKMKKLVIFTGLFTFVTMVSAASDFSVWNKYADSLKSCLPGKFDLPDPATKMVSETPDVITYQIVGMDAGVCKVNVSKITPNGQGGVTVMTQHCAFAEDKLSVLSKSARDVAVGVITTNDPATVIMTSSCKSEQ